MVAYCLGRGGESVEQAWVEEEVKCMNMYCSHLQSSCVVREGQQKTHEEFLQLKVFYLLQQLKSLDQLLIGSVDYRSRGGGTEGGVLKNPTHT